MTSNANTTGNPLAEWEADFREDVDTLRKLTLLLTHPDDYEPRNELEPDYRSLNSVVIDLEFIAGQIRRHLQAELASIQQLEQTKEVVVALSKRAAAIGEHMPPDLATHFTNSFAQMERSKENDAGARNANATALVEKNPCHPSTAENTPAKVPATASAKSDVVKKVTRKPNSKSSAATTANVPAKTKSKSVKSKNPTQESANENEQKNGVTVSFVTREQLDSAPQYVKGRMSVEKVNAVAQRLGEIASAKYGLLRRPNSALSIQERTLCQDFQQAQCAETKGAKFLTDNEIKGFGEYRIDSTVKSGINILRHFGMLKETRGKDRVRILIINTE